MAEIVDYDVIWAKPKQSDNVVWYNFREEQSIADFSKTNANNQTSTWQADIVYWVNRPKIIAETSIVWDLWWWGWWGGSLKYCCMTTGRIRWDASASTELTWWTMTQNLWFTENSWIVISKWWLYLISAYVYTHNNKKDSTISLSMRIGTQSTSMEIENIRAYNLSVSYYIQFNDGDIVKFYGRNNGDAAFTPETQITFIKLA